ncbi:MAG: hypothetical protein IPN19_10375 [Elusimicrobia bacterium]|nr:hypothetical protein [Elusimicrobiota bacterium]
MAFIVIFHANAARTRDMTNAFIRVLRWVAWPILFLVRVVSLGKFQVPLFAWDIAETHGRANIFTTQVGKPISVSVEKFSPRAFYVNGVPAAPRATLAETRGNLEHSSEEPSSSFATAQVPQPSLRATIPQVSDQKGGDQDGNGIVNVIGRVIRRLFQFMVVLCASIILTSSNGKEAFISSVENGVRQTFNVALVSDVSFTSSILDAQRPVIEVPANSPRAFVNTKKTPLLSFDRNPSDIKQVIGRVGAHYSVKVVGRKGAWVLVSAGSGKRGWVNSRYVREASGGRMTVVRSVPLLKTPVFRMPNLSRGAEVAVLMTQGKWVRVAPLDNPKTSVWVSAQYLSANPPVDVTDPAEKTGSHTETMTAMQPLADRVQGLLSSMGQPIPVLGDMADRVMKEGKPPYRPGDVLHRRLMAGAINEFGEGSARDAAVALTGFIDQASLSGLDQTDQQLALALGYGAVAGEKWAQKGPPQDRALYDDYRRTRALFQQDPLSARAGRALTRLARRASGWKTSHAPVFAPGALPVINLSEANFDSSLLGDWAEALERVARGEPAPVVVVRNPAQQTKWEAALKAWRQAHLEMGSTLTDETIPLSRWVYLDNLGADVVDRNEDGIVQVVRIGALLGSAQVDMSGFAGGVDVLTGVGTSLTWDRSDVPASIAVRMIIGVFEGLYLSAPLDEAQKNIRAVRQALAAA